MKKETFVNAYAFYFLDVEEGRSCKKSYSF